MTRAGLLVFAPQHRVLFCLSRPVREMAMTFCRLVCLIAALALGCAACGQRGKLYLPDDKTSMGTVPLS
ncbi:MAG: LPS translocon maturation chaperone LptM [Gammaproteobacteria bacterium]